MILENHDKIKEIEKSKKLEIVRYLGHSFDIPGSAYWNIFTNEKSLYDSCWICDYRIYSLIFWSKSIG
jgi:hypothetical protein